MKFKHLLHIVLLLVCASASAQKCYIKPSIRYNGTLALQPSPVFFQLTIPVGRGNYFYIYPTGNISLAKGGQYGLSVGKEVYKGLGLELSVAYFSNSYTHSNDIASRNSTGNVQQLITDWHFKSVNLYPTIFLNKDYGKSNYIGKFSTVVGYSCLLNSETYSNYSETYTLKPRISLGYAFGFEYNYQISKQFSLVGECGIETYTYTPRKGNLKSIISRGESVSLDNIDTQKKEIDYVSEIKDYENTQDKPLQRFKESIVINQYFMSLGCKINLK